MLTFLYLTISIFFITLTMTTLASFAKASEIFESMDDYKIPVEESKEPTSEELCKAWIDSLHPDALNDFDGDKLNVLMDDFIELSKTSDACSMPNPDPLPF